MDTTIFSIKDKDFGTVYFAKQSDKVFVIGRELVHAFGYDCFGNAFAPGRELAKITKVLDLRSTKYRLLIKNAGKAKWTKDKEVKCAELNDFIKYLKTARIAGKQLGKRMRILDFLNKHFPSPFDGQEEQTKPKLFKGLYDEITALENRFKVMQINLDSQKEQIDAKDRSIFALRAKIKELEEQNTLLRSQLENQTKLNKSIGSLVSEWTALNNVTA